MTSGPACLLCGAPDPTREATASVAELRRLYRVFLDVDVSGELPPHGDITLWVCGRCGLKYYDPPSPGGPDLYDALQRHDWYYLDEKSEYQIALSWLPAKARVLEVGCGRGTFGGRLPSTADYVGLELSPGAAEKARQSGLDVRVESTSTHLARNAGRYDAVVAFQVLEHVADPRQFVQECADLLAPGGLLLTSVPAEDGFVGAQTNNLLNLPPHHVTRWPDATFSMWNELFPVELLAVVPDQMSVDHRGDYISELIARRLGLAAPEGRLLRSSRSATRGLQAVRRLGAWISRGVTDDRLQPRGFSVTAVARRLGGQ